MFQRDSQWRKDLTAIEESAVSSGLVSKYIPAPAGVTILDEYGTLVLPSGLNATAECNRKRTMLELTWETAIERDGAVVATGLRVNLNRYRDSYRAAAKELAGLAKLPERVVLGALPEPLAFYLPKFIEDVEPVFEAIVGEFSTEGENRGIGYISEVREFRRKLIEAVGSPADRGDRLVLKRDGTSEEVFDLARK